MVSAHLSSYFHFIKSTRMQSPGPGWSNDAVKILDMNQYSKRPLWSSSSKSTLLLLVLCDFGHGSLIDSPHSKSNHNISCFIFVFVRWSLALCTSSRWHVSTQNVSSIISSWKWIHSLAFYYSALHSFVDSSDASPRINEFGANPILFSLSTCF